MLRRISFFLAPLVFVFVLGCGAALVPFSHELRREHDLTAHDLQNIQFYISSKVVLRRELEKEDKVVTATHKLVLVSGKRVEEVVIAKGTPCVAVKVAADRLAVSFEPGASIVFSAGADRVPVEPVAPRAQEFASPPEPFPGNKIAGDDAPRSTPSAFGDYFLAVDRDGSLEYQGKRWRVVEEGEEAHLLINARALNSVETSTKVVPGMKLD